MTIYRGITTDRDSGSIIGVMGNSIVVVLGKLYIQIVTTVATPNKVFHTVSLFWICYIEFFFNISGFTCGSFRLIRPSNLIKF